MIDMRFKPSWLPQVSAPIKYVIGKLKDEGIDCKMIKIAPSKVIPSQGIVFSEKMSDFDSSKMKPIWISNDNKNLDGHHRLGSALSHEEPYIKAIKVDLNHNDAARALNKVMDIYDFEKQQAIEEVVAQDQINAMNDPDTDPANFLEMLEAENEDDKEILHDDNAEIVGKKKKKITAYRKDNLKENSGVGNFFSLKPIDGYKKYEIEFDNLLDTNDMGVIYHGDKSPTLILAKNWFPNIKFSNIAKKHNIKPDILINRAIAEKARKMGYDGIKYGDIIVQGFE